jgi:hypothetical protein
MESENIAGKRHQRRTAAERIEILEQFRDSGLTRRAFSQTHDVALSTLSKWLTDTKRKPKAASRVLFRELRFPLAPAAPAMQWAVEIVGPDGVMIRCRESLALSDVAWLLRGR